MLALLIPKGDPYFQSKLKQTMWELLFEKTTPSLINSDQMRVSPEYFASYISGAHLSVIQVWLNNGCKTPEEMAKVLSMLTVKVLLCSRTYSGLGKDSSAERLKLSYFAVKKVLIDFKSIESPLIQFPVMSSPVSRACGRPPGGRRPVRHQQLCVQPRPAAPADRIVRSVRRYRPLAQRFRHLSGKRRGRVPRQARAEIRLCRYDRVLRRAWAFAALALIGLSLLSRTKERSGQPANG